MVQLFFKKKLSLCVYCLIFLLNGKRAKAFLEKVFVEPETFTLARPAGNLDQFI